MPCGARVGDSLSSRISSFPAHSMVRSLAWCELTARTHPSTPTHEGPGYPSNTGCGLALALTFPRRAAVLLLRGQRGQRQLRAGSPTPPGPTDARGSGGFLCPGQERASGGGDETTLWTGKRKVALPCLGATWLGWLRGAMPFWLRVASSQEPHLHPTSQRNPGCPGGRKMLWLALCVPWG